jgi:hypothetical protein
MTLRLIESNEALQAELVASRKSAGKLAGDQISAHAVVRKATGQLRHTRSPIKSTAASPRDELRPLLRPYRTAPTGPTCSTLRLWASANEPYMDGCG